MNLPLRAIARLLSVAAPCVCFTACRENPVSFYEAPADHSHDHAQHQHAHGGAASVGGGSASGAARLTWTKPEAWTEKPGSEMRLASFGYTAPDGSEADVSIFSFPDAAGGLVANINRWRGQVGLPPVEEAELATTAERIEVNGLPSWFVDFAGTAAGADATSITRITGAVVPVGTTSWFFKMMGPDTVVRSQRGAFDTLIASVRAVTPTPAPAADPHAGVPGAPPLGGAAAPGSMAMDPNAVPPPPKQAGFAYDTPEGWQSRGTTQFRLASFQIPGNGVPAADMSVSAFPGMGGGDLANVNRWRGQVGLGQISEVELAATSTTITSRGLTFLVVDMTSPAATLEGGRKNRILGAILNRGDTGWFFKMTGESELVGKQREPFLEFLRSFRFE